MENQFSQPTRQSPAAIVFILGNVLRMLVRQLWVVVVVVLFNPKRRSLDTFTFVLLGLALVGAATSILSFFNTFFYIRNGELVLEKGFLRRVKLAVPLDRVQSVNFRQGILHQALNVVSVEMDTAGSAGKEFSLQAIRLEQAEALRGLVENYKSAHKTTCGATETPAEESPSGDAQLPQSPQLPQSLIFNLTLLDLLKIGVSQNHLRTAGFLFLFAFSFADDLGEALGFKLGDKIQSLAGEARNPGFLFYLLLGVPFFLLLSFLSTLVRTVLRYFNLRFWRTERGFKMVSGLFTRQEVSANLRKIQFVQWSSNPLKRLFGMVSVRLPQAASAEAGRRQSVSLPGCYAPHLAAIRQAWFPEENDLPQEEHGISPLIVRKQFLLQGVLPAAVLLAANLDWTGAFGWWWLLWLPVAWRLSAAYHRTWRWHVSEQGLRTERGVLHRQSVLLRWHKVQAVTVSQSWLQRRSGLSTLTLHTAAGAVGVPYLPVEKAQAVQNFVLWKVETDGRRWM